jgi:hypothetical protein
MSALNITPQTKQQDGLAALAGRIRAECQAAQRAWSNALGHVLDAGDLLIQAQRHVSTNWKAWLREHCFMGVSTAQLYQQLARHRQEIEAELSRAPGLTLRGARHLIKQAAKKAEKPTKEKSTKRSTELVTSLAALWGAASPEDRMAFLDEITLGDLLEVMPASWKVEIERRVISSLAARFSDAKTTPAIKAMQRLVEDTRLLALKPAGSA